MIARTDERLLTFHIDTREWARTGAPAAVRIVLPGSPLTQNTIYRIAVIKPRGAPQHATLMMTPEGRAYLAAVRAAILSVRPLNWNNGWPVDVEAVYYFETLVPDVDGPGKLVLDALGADRPRKDRKGNVHQVFPGGVLVHNDRQVRDFLQRRRLDRNQPRLELLVVSIPPAQRGLL